MRTFTTVLFLLATLAGPEVRAQQYCMLPGRTSYSTAQPGITSFKLNTINRTSAGVEQSLNNPPIVETNDSTKLVRGKTYTITISHSKDAVNFPTARNNVRVWIDYNHNFDFNDAGETVVSKDFEAPGTTTATFTVPANAPLGATMLRATAKMSSDAGHTIPTSCDDPEDPIGYHGEMEDYKVTIVQFPSEVEDINNTPVISVYPNPVANKINIALNTIESKSLSVAVYDITGKQIANLLDEKVQSSLTYSFSLRDYAIPAGVYFINVNSGGASFHQKVIKVD
jgi:hypothetical protein